MSNVCGNQMTMYDPQDDTHGYCCEEGAWPDNDGDGLLVLPLVLSDLKERAAAGKEKYGNDYRVETRNKPLKEAYEEAIDLCMYLRSAIEKYEEE